MIAWRIHHSKLAVSTNLDAQSGKHGDVFTADFQTEGRGRLGHKWLSAPGENLIMSAVLSVEGMEPQEAATLPLAAGLAAAKAVGGLLKWPNDVLVGGRKVAGILCERRGDCVIVGIGVNVRQTKFPAEISDSAASLVSLGRKNASVDGTRDTVLAELADAYERWRAGGFAAIHGEIAALDCLRGKRLSVRQTDSDGSPVRGVCGGIAEDGSLDVGGTRVYAGEAHVEEIA